MKTSKPIHSSLSGNDVTTQTTDVVKPARKPQSPNPNLPVGRRGKDTKPRKPRSDNWDPDEAQLKTLESIAGIVNSLAQVAHVIGIHPKTLFRKMRENPEIRATVERGRALANANVGKTAYQMAKSGRNADMTKFWLKARAGWRDTQAIEIGRGRDYENYNDEDLEAELCEQERMLNLMEPVEGENETSLVLKKTLFSR